MNRGRQSGRKLAVSLSVAMQFYAVATKMGPGAAMPDISPSPMSCMSRMFVTRHSRGAKTRSAPRELVMPGGMRLLKRHSTDFPLAQRVWPSVQTPRQ